MNLVIDRPVLILLRLEGLTAFTAGLTAYFWLTDGWYVLALAALAPDLSMIGYAFGPTVGARAYNLAHTYVTPALLALLGLWFTPILIAVASVWIAHIGIDRALGYGLKSSDGFGVTHLGRIGMKIVH